MPNAVTAIFGGDARPLERTMERVMELGTRLGEALGVGIGIEKFINLEESIGQLGRSLKDTSERLGITTDEVQTLNYAAEETGSNLEHIASGLDRLAKSKEMALEGGKDGEKLIETFARFGVTIEQIRSSTPIQLFQAIGDSIEQTGVNSRVTADSLGLMGRAGSALIPTLKELAKNSKDFENSPLKMSKSDIDAIDRAALAWERLGNTTKVVLAKSQIGWMILFKNMAAGFNYVGKGLLFGFKNPFLIYEPFKPKPIEPVPDFRVKGNEVESSRSGGSEMADIEARRLELAEKIFQNSLKTMTATEKEEALKKAIAKHEANAAYYASVGDSEAEKKSLDEKNKAEELRGQMIGIETKKDKQANTKLSLNAQQQIGSYARTPGSWNETKADIKAIRQSLSHINSNHNAPPGPQRPKFGAHSH